MRNVCIAFMIIFGIITAPALYAAELYGIVADKDGKPLQTKVTLKDANETQVGEPITTDKNGSYAFKDIKPGTYHVLIGEKNDWKIFVGPGETRRDFRLK
jgi:Carboxypeptidase regulatory-like domain